MTTKIFLSFSLSIYVFTPWTKDKKNPFRRQKGGVEAVEPRMVHGFHLLRAGEDVLPLSFFGKFLGESGSLESNWWNRNSPLPHAIQRTEKEQAEGQEVCSEVHGWPVLLPLRWVAVYARGALLVKLPPLIKARNA